MSILQVKNLSKTFGKHVVVDDVSFDIEEGEIFGFLGPNGAGKSTTIKMICGLIKPTKGDIFINSFNIKDNKKQALSSVGAIIEAPGLYTYMTGRQNLMQLARLYKVDKSRITEIIKLIGLESRIDDLVRKYSLGMKQRLGLGLALLSNPKLLILDEPTNGLDTNGIIEFRQLIKDLSSKYGTTILISSHILSEIQKICDRVAFINNGKIQMIKNLNDIVTTLPRYIITDIKEGDYKKIDFSKFNYIKSHEFKDLKIRISYTGKTTDINEFINYLFINHIPYSECYKEKINIEEEYLKIISTGDMKKW